MASSSPFPDEQLDEMAEQLGESEDRYNGLAKTKKKLETDLEALRRQVSDMDAAIRRHESEKLTKENQVRSLQVTSVLKCFDAMNLG